VIGDDGLKAYLSERDRIVAALDLKAYRELGKAYGFPVADDGRIALVALHKARTAITAMPDELRDASEAWLKERGYKSWR